MRPGPLDRLEEALERGVPQDVLNKIAAPVLSGANLHTVLEYCAIRTGDPDRHRAIAAHLPGVGDLNKLALVGGSPSHELQTLRAAGVALWEVGEDGTGACSCESALMEFRDALRGGRASIGFADILHAALGELIDNAAEHGAGAAPAVVATVIRNGTCSFSVTDVGVGVLESMRGYYPELMTGVEALERCLEDGVSGTGKPGRGNGFNPLFRALASRRAHLRFRSSTGAIAWSATAPDRHDLPAKVLPGRLGFHVEVSVPLLA